jgi:hypothetical protein
MQEPVSPLTLDFLAWISTRPRTYAEAMEAWRTTCPRHSIWEDALIGGLIQVDVNESVVTLTPQGRAVLDKSS